MWCKTEGVRGCQYRIVCFEVEQHRDDRGGGLVVDGALEHDDALFQQAREDIVAGWRVGLAIWIRPKQGPKDSREMRATGGFCDVLWLR